MNTQIYYFYGSVLPLATLSGQRERAHERLVALIDMVRELTEVEEIQEQWGT